MSNPSELGRRAVLRAAAVSAAGLWADGVFRTLNAADDAPPAGDEAVGRKELAAGLDGMSRAADDGRDAFVSGHNAAAVIASAFFCRDEKLDADTRKELLAVVGDRLLVSPIYAPRPDEKPDPALADGIVADLAAGADTLLRSGHNIIFAAAALKALRAVPAAATPERVAGLRKTVRSFGAGKGKAGPVPDRETFADLADEPAFVAFAVGEYLKALELYLVGKGHHGFAGHVLTIAHALLDLRRLGHRDAADRGVRAYWEFVRQARVGADLGGKKVANAPPAPPTPRDKAYWVGQGKRRAGEIVGSHLIKYPYSFYALVRELKDEALRRRAFETLYYLTAIT
jgi:hypothetical protein